MTIRAAILIALMCVLTTAARAQEVTTMISPRDVYVGIPFNLTISLENCNEYEISAVPNVVGLRIDPTPHESRRSMTSIVNGRMTQRSSVDISFGVVATGAGTIQIPSFDIVVDGRTVQTQPVTFVAGRVDPGDLVYLDVRAPRQTYYLGERLDVTLELWIKAYTDEEHNVELDAVQMWDRVSGRSNWGVFQAALDNRQVTYRDDSRADAAGEQTRYFVYSLPASTWPERDGRLSFSDVAALVEYPTGVSHRRDLLGRRRLELESRPVIARLETTPVDIVQPPAEGRPEVYAGAVGRFAFSVTASPRDVAVGDPITLTMTVRDLMQGRSQLEFLAAPPLDRVPALVEGFRVPDELLGGTVNDRSKVFTQTIRARDASVTEIPPIPFAAFNPADEQYEIAMSDPIPITVRSVETVGLDEVVGSGAGSDQGPTELTEMTGGLMANYSGAALLAQDETRAGWGVLVALLVPPAVFGVAVAQRHRTRRHADGRIARRRRAAAVARQRLSDDPEQAGAALCDYVADRLHLPAGALTADEAVARLASAGVDDDAVDEVRAFLAACDEARYAGGDASALAEGGRRCIEHLERARW